MYNWNTDVSTFNKKSDHYRVWKLNQLINFGLHGEKLNLKHLQKFWDKIITDKPTKKFLSMIAWPKQS